MSRQPYRPPPWLPGPHLQTLWALACQPPQPHYRRERWTTPDGDFIDLDWLAGRADAPLLVLFHGLEGSSRSHYARALMGALQGLGWRGVVPHFRGCSGEPNRRLRAYHSGDSAEIHWILQRLRDRAGAGCPLLVTGASLGGNALLKWLGEQGQGALALVEGAAAICPPLDLTLAGHALGRGWNRLYTRHFLSTLKPKALLKAAHFPGQLDPAAIGRATTLYAFDNAYTAPVHGFRDADDYWTQASSRPWLRHIRVPTLLLSADNDPFVPPEALPTPGELSPQVAFEHPAKGGHLGFVEGPWPGQTGWLATRLIRHFTHCLAGKL